MHSHKEKAVRARWERREHTKDRKTFRWHIGQGFGSHKTGEQTRGLEKHIPVGETRRSWPSAPLNFSRLPGRSEPSETHRFWQANGGLGEVFSQAARKKKMKKSQIGQVAVSCESCSPRPALCHLPPPSSLCCFEMGEPRPKNGK